MSNNKKEAAKTAKKETKNAAEAAAQVEPINATPTAAPETEQPTPTETPTEAKPMTARERMEEAQLNAAELRREWEAKKRDLDNCLADLKHKKELADHREKFLATLEQLNEAEDLVKPTEFECKRMKLRLYEVNDYGREGEFSVSITNGDLILEFVAMLKDKINAKIKELETELVK